MLVCHNQYFIQYLEGNKDDVTSLFDKIKLDPRHRNIDLISASEVRNPIFHDWSLGHLITYGDEIKIINDFFTDYLSSKQKLDQLDILSTLSFFTKIRSQLVA
jgi:hypothetical protein